MIDLMRHGRMLADAVREKTRLEREISIVQARINTLAAEISALVETTSLDGAPVYMNGPAVRLPDPETGVVHYNAPLRLVTDGSEDFSHDRS